MPFLPTATPEKRGFSDHQATGIGIEGGLHTERKRGVVGAVTEWELVDHRHTQGCQTLLQHLFERLRVRPGRTAFLTLPLAAFKITHHYTTRSFEFSCLAELQERPINPFGTPPYLLKPEHGTSHLQLPALSH